MNITSSKIDPLGKDNFETWKMHMEAILIMSDGWDYVTGAKQRPRADADGKAWDTEDKKVKSTIILAISPSELRQVKDCQTARDVWVRLYEIYQSKGPARKAMLLKRLILTKMEGTSVRDHVRSFFDIVDRLKDLDIEINNDMLSIILLYSLPEEYDNFRCAIESRDELPKPESLKIKVIEESDARQSKSSVVTTNSDALTATVTCEKGTRNQFKFKSNITCYRCRKKGHLARNCRTRQVANRMENASCQDRAVAFFVNEQSAFSTSRRNHGEAVGWHRRPGHMNEPGLKSFKERNTAFRMKFDSRKKLNVCKACVSGKLSDPELTELDRRAIKPLKVIRSDLCGPMRVDSIGDLTRGDGGDRSESEFNSSEDSVLRREPGRSDLVKTGRKRWKKENMGKREGFIGQRGVESVKGKEMDEGKVKQKNVGADDIGREMNGPQVQQEVAPKEALFTQLEEERLIAVLRECMTKFFKKLTEKEICHNQGAFAKNPGCHSAILGERNGSGSHKSRWKNED